MSRRVLIVLAGVALMVALYLHDRDTLTQEVLPATVTGIEDRTADAGADSWHVTVRLASGEEVALDPRLARPDLAPGDPLCVLRLSQPSAPDRYRRADAGDSC